MPLPNSKCSFCGNEVRNGGSIFQGPGVTICDTCVTSFKNMLDFAHQSSPATGSSNAPACEQCGKPMQRVSGSTAREDLPNEVVFECPDGHVLRIVHEVVEDEYEIDDEDEEA